MDKNLIEGVTITPLQQIEDARGAVLHMIRSNSPDFTYFGECYFSEVLPGMTKGWKYHRLQTQNLAVPIGQIRIVLYDDREGVITKGHLKMLNLGRPENYVRLRIPPRVWYAFSCTSKTSALIVNCADMPHDSAESITLPLNDPKIPYQW